MWRRRGRQVLLQPGDALARRAGCDRTRAAARRRARAGCDRARACAARRRATQRFEQAARLEAADPPQALRIYRSLARENGPWAENALYAAGRLELEHGQHARARQLLRRYLDRYPDGVNASDARSLLARTADTSETRAPTRRTRPSKETTP